jgi:hypothetical protein
VHVSELDQRKAPEGVADGPAQRFGTIEDEQAGLSGRNPGSTRSASNALTTEAFYVAFLATASTCLSPAPSMPITATNTWLPTSSPAIWINAPEQIPTQPCGHRDKARSHLAIVDRILRGRVRAKS